MTALEKRSAEAASLSDRLETETTLRQTAETHRNRLAEQLVLCTMPEPTYVWFY